MKHYNPDLWISDLWISGSAIMKREVVFVLYTDTCLLDILVTSMKEKLIWDTSSFFFFKFY